MTRNRVSISLSFLAIRFIYSTAIDTAATLFADLRTTFREWEVDDRCTRRNLLGKGGKATDEAATFDDNLLVTRSRIMNNAKRKDSLGVDSFSLLDMQEIDSSNSQRLRGGQSNRSAGYKNYQADQRNLLENFDNIQLVSEKLRGDQLEDNQDENNQQEGDRGHQLAVGQLGGAPRGGTRQIQRFQQERDQLGDDRWVVQWEDDQWVDDQWEDNQWEDDQWEEGDFFNLRQHWYPGTCWQEEWREREWCMQCPGNQCDEGEWLWVEECAPIPTQRFQWVPKSNVNNNNKGQLKMAFWNLCLQRTRRRYFDLEECDASNENQFFIRFSMGVVFELHPAHNTSMCVTQHHHPKDFEEIFAMSCSDARNSHTSYWDTNWQGEQELNLREHVNCTSSQPCGKCAGDCDSDHDCEGGLTCFFRNDNTPVPGCSGIGRFGTDYCVKPPAGDYDDANETAVDIEENADENTVSPTYEIPAGNYNGADGTAVDVEEENGEGNVVSPWSITAGIPDTRCTDVNPCRICQGYCDSEDQCEGDLKCFQTFDSDAIGCLGNAPFGFTYCMDPSNIDQGIIRHRQPGCTNESPCNECEGGCNSDGQCEGDLSCFFRDGDEEVPGCVGRGITGRDYCVNPSNFVLHQLLNRRPTDTDLNATFSSFP